jgi:serine/threonine protein kinase
MAPEVITKNNHGFAADFFAIGVIAYELMLGKVPIILTQRPYLGKNRQ